MDWGHAQIDELGLECFIEALPLGRWLYESCGYRWLMDVHVNMERKEPSVVWKRLMREMRRLDLSLMWRCVRGEWEGERRVGPREGGTRWWIVLACFLRYTHTSCWDERA